MTVEKMCKQYKEYKNMIKEIETELDQLRNEILAQMNGQEKISAGPFTVSNCERKRTGLDAKALSKDFPDIYREYQIFTSYRVFTVR